MITLTYGRKKPETGNRGQAVFSALTSNIDLDDSHDHNGVNSKKLSAVNLNKATVLVNAAYTPSVSQGLYTYTVPMPSGHNYSLINTRYFVVGTVGGISGAEFHPSVSLSGTNLLVTTAVNAASTNFTIVFG